MLNAQLEEAETNASGSGRMSVMDTFVASTGPRFCTSRKYVKIIPGCNAFTEADFAIERLASFTGQTTLTGTEERLLARTMSFDPVTCALFVSCELQRG